MGKISQKAFGQYIKKVRTEKNMSREELADRLGVSYAAIEKWENGKRYPDFEMVENIADALGISVQDIYDNSKSEESRSIIIPVVSSIILIALIVGACILGFMHKGKGREQVTTNQETTEADTTEKDTTEEDTTEEDTTEVENTTKADETTIPGELVEINIYSERGSYYGEQLGYMAKVFENDLGIKVNYISNIDGNYLDDDGKLKGDIVIAYKDNYDQLVNNGKLFDLYENDFLNNFANDYIKEGLAEYIKSESIANDGKLFGFEINERYGNTADVGAFDFGTCLRWDIYKQLGYPEIKNLDDLAKVLKEMKELYPKDDKGNEVEAIGLFKYLETDLPYPVTAMLQSYYGVSATNFGYYDIRKEKYVTYVSDEDDYYRNILYFFNKLYREGLLKTDTLYEDCSVVSSYLSDGRYLMTVTNWMLGAYNFENNTDQGKVMLPVMAEEAVNIASPSGDNGGFYWCISNNAENKEKCMELINYLASPEGMLTILYGPRKLCWDYDENMNTYLTDFGYEVRDNGMELMPEEWGGAPFSDGVMQTNAYFWSNSSKNPDANNEDYILSHWKTYIPPKISDIEEDWVEHTGYNNTFSYYAGHNFVAVQITDLDESPADEELQKNIVLFSEKAIFAADDAEFEQAINGLRALDK